uniref:Uncharacterized protein n=1 Tax=Panagrolaimus superbus TaxID=310955 RepID=A0A914Y5S0_9BILA
MASADYLKKYLSSDDSKNKKKRSQKIGKSWAVRIKVVEDDAFIMVEPNKSREMYLDEEEIDETEEEIREKQKLAEKLKFRSDTFLPVEKYSKYK